MDAACVASHLAASFVASDAPPGPPFYCAVIVGLLLELLARAIYTGAASFLLPVGAGIAYFTWCGVRGLLRNLPAFRKEMQLRAAQRQRAPLHADDSH